MKRLAILALALVACSETDTLETDQELGQNPAVKIDSATLTAELRQFVDNVDWRSLDIDLNEGGLYPFRNLDSEIREWRQRAEQGDQVSQAKLGNLYRLGFGVAKDDAEAVKWYRLAAEQGGESVPRGRGAARFRLGLMYAAGEGVPKDDAEAVKWFRLVAERGEALGMAQFSLGSMYANGWESVPQDLVLAYAWTNLATAHLDILDEGGQVFARMRDLLRESMTLDQITQAQEMSAGKRPWDLR